MGGEAKMTIFAIIVEHLQISGRHNEEDDEKHEGKEYFFQM